MLVPLNPGRVRAVPPADAPEAARPLPWVDASKPSGGDLAASRAEPRMVARASSLNLHRPLDAIIAHTAALLNDWRGALPAEARRLVFAIGARALDLERMLEGLGRLTALAQLPARRERLSLEQLVNEVWAGLAPLRRDREVALELGSLPVVPGDRFLLAQALGALLENALKFTRARPAARVEVGCVYQRGEFVCWVRDNGVGFEPARARLLFEPFARLREHDAFEGPGLGLALVGRIVERHGGRAWATGKRGAGAQFFFVLPGA
jgi:signal transduction histidine kinase